MGCAKRNPSMLAERTCPITIPTRSNPCASSAPTRRIGCRTGRGSTTTSRSSAAGRAGCALGLALRRAGIGRVTVIDQAEDEEAGRDLDQRGADERVAHAKEPAGAGDRRRRRSGFQAWYEARHGRPPMTAIGRIPRARLGRVSRLVPAFPRHRRCATAPGSTASNRRTGISGCISSTGPPVSRPRAR